MDMDAKDIQLDLQALKRLYGLLEKDGNGTSNADSLDEHARLMLKNLLDEATKKVLKLHSEIISGRIEASTTVSPFRLQQPDYESSKEHPLSKYSIERKNVNGLLDITLWGETSFSGPQTRKKRCRVCLKNTVKHLQPIDDDDDDDNGTIFFDVPQNLNNEEETGSFLDESKEADCLSKEASEAIKKIELCIAALCIGADHLHPFDNSSQTRNRNFSMCQIDDSFMTGNSFLSEFSNQRLVDPLHQVLPIVTSAEETNQPYLLLGQTFKLVPPTKAMFKHSPNNFIVDDVESGRNWFRNVQNPSVALDPNESSYRASTVVDRGENPSQKAPQKDEIQTNKYRKIAAATTYIQNQESELTSTDSYSNSTYTDSREYSSGDKNYTSSTSSEIEGSLTSHGSDTTSNTDEEEAYSYTSSESTPREATSSSSSENEGYSSSYNHPTSKKLSYKKQIGMWRSLKDKLAVIFHHHHHHHHHYGKDRKKMSRNKSLYKGRVDSLKREHEVYGEKAVEKTSKSLVREKNGQKNNFHGLMGGVLKHVRKPKKRTKKRGKESGGQLTKKKNLNKSHWWKLMQLHRGGKLTSKSHVKLGLGKKKARLKALPTIKCD